MMMMMKMMMRNKMRNYMTNTIYKRKKATGRLSKLQRVVNMQGANETRGLFGAIHKT